MFSSAFSGNGHDISLVKKRYEALSLLKTLWFDIIMIDLTTSGIDGLEFLCEINILASDTETILLTADGGIEIRLEIVKIATDEFIVSSAGVNGIGLFLEKVLHNHKATTASLNVCIKCRRVCLHRGQALISDKSSPPAM